MTERTPGQASDLAHALAAQGRIQEAYALLGRAVLAGDGHAAATLADWRMAGHYIRRDIPEAGRLYGEAARLGLSAAADPFLALLANGAGGGERDWRGAVEFLAQRARQDPLGREQLSLIGAMTLTVDGTPVDRPPRTPLSAHPPIEQFPGLLTQDECRYLRQIALPRLSRALVVDPRTGAQRPDPVRIARAAAFPFVEEDLVLHAINQRIATATETRWEQGEPSQVLAYRPGEEYRLHSDALPPGSNQRIVTFLVALNDDYEGGETSFPAIGLDWRGQTGDALMFSNVGSDGAPLEAARHAGKPVRCGSKYILSRWIRRFPLDLTGPPGRPF